MWWWTKARTKDEVTEARCSAREQTLPAPPMHAGCASLPVEYLLDEADDGSFWARGVQAKCDQSQCMDRGQELHPWKGQVLHAFGVLAQAAHS